ncbi:hypothetical protein AMTR_s00143p00108380 [Amborella trichopoda]|uniref:Uncharacterized protein n=1 Tax=Amborella trichopoda TaxID=13333 RepID=W1PFZ7_AMBTC|nr:hypothetical protein AMTR_s00143p00108380 [Amborella trichopoda]
MANQHNEVNLLDIAQFCHNLHRSSLTGKSALEFTISQRPLMPHDVALQQGEAQYPMALRLGKAGEE